MSLELKAELVMAIKGYECEGKQRWDEGMDFSASDSNSDDKILLRVMTPKSKYGVVGLDEVKNMIRTMNDKDCDKGILISEKFSNAARREMDRENIQMILAEHMTSFKPQRVYLTIQDCINDLCKAKCGLVPKKESDCKGYSEGHYSCKIRLISDDASFHFEHQWINLLMHDLIRLLEYRNSE